jgi:hypothetical protein
VGMRLTAYYGPMPAASGLSIYSGGRVPLLWVILYVGKHWMRTGSSFTEG